MLSNVAGIYGVIEGPSLDAFNILLSDSSGKSKRLYMNQLYFSFLMGVQNDSFVESLEYHFGARARNEDSA